MKLGLVSDSLGNLDFESMLDTAAAEGVQGVEINAGNWSSAPHLDLAGLLDDAAARGRFLDAIRARGLELIALNANGNQLHPVSGAAQSKVVYDTVRLAGLLGVETVCMMSGLPGGGPEDRTPNWVVSAWPPETGEILAWQWQERLLPYWHDLARFAGEHGVRRLGIEMHGNQLVYNVPTLLRLREAVGPVVGANLDPSHLMWMGADPIAAVEALGAAIHHVHAKDTGFNPGPLGLTSRLDTGSMAEPRTRSWNYITLGYGHGETWWRDFCYRLRQAGYDGWLSIEHEDPVLARREGIARSVALLRAVAPDAPSDYTLQPA